MTGFSVWNWFIAVKGVTTIEFWTGEMTNYDQFNNPVRKPKNSFETASDNLYRVFGTHKLFRVLSPSLRNVPFTGLEWSFRYKDDGYDCNGYPLNLYPSQQQNQ